MAAQIQRKSEFWPRLLLRLRQFGLSNHDIAEVFNISEHTVRHHIGSQMTQAKRTRSRLFMGRVMGRLVANPYRWTQGQVAEVWGCSNVWVCKVVAEARYQNPRAA